MKLKKILEGFGSILRLFPNHQYNFSKYNKTPNFILKDAEKIAQDNYKIMQDFKTAYQKKINNNQS